jgi:hypothetical protein
MVEKQEELMQVAQEYCALIEQIDDNEKEIFPALIQLLPRLHASIQVFADEKDGDCHVKDADLDARFELFSRLRQLLGERDGYWLEYDVRSNEECKSGSLADDLTDIYCELKSGLLSLEEKIKDKDAAIDDWRCGFKVHWGKHLVDAEKHLYDLQASNQL